MYILLSVCVPLRHITSYGILILLKYAQNKKNTYNLAKK